MSRTAVLSFSAILLLLLPEKSYADEEDFCARVFNIGTWRTAQDTRIISAAEKAYALSNISHRVYVCEGTTLTAHIAFSIIPYREQLPDVIFVAMSTEFAAKYPDSLTAIFAHEFAHYRTSDGELCGMYNTPLTFMAYIQCEAMVDVQASQWVGKDAVIQALKDAREYESPRIEGATWSRMYSAFSRRIRAVEQAGE